MPVEAALAPAELPTHSVGSKWLHSRDGKQTEMELVSVDGDELAFRTSSGCSWTRPRNIFAPALTYANCRGDTGSQTLADAGGRIWPLAVGNAQSWSVTGKNTEGQTWSTKRSCKVVSTERVKVAAGEFDTYKVVCRDTWRTRTWYYAPSVESTVVFINHHRRKNSTVIRELVSAPSGR
jgi:hypothetical protein